MQFPSLKIKAEIEVGSTVANGCGKDFRPVVSCRCLNAICGPQNNLRKIGFPTYSLLVHFLFFKKKCLATKNPFQQLAYCMGFSEGYMVCMLGGGFKYVLFSPLPGEKIPILTNIFQRG